MQKLLLVLKKPSKIQLKGKQLIKVCIALMNGTIQGDTAEIIFFISYHDAPMSTATTVKSTTTLPSSHFLPFSPFLSPKNVTPLLYYAATNYNPSPEVILTLERGAVSRQCFFITIVDDDEIESEEWFRVSATLLQSSISDDLITLTATEAQIAIDQRQ